MVRMRSKLAHIMVRDGPCLTVMDHIVGKRRGRSKKIASNLFSTEKSRHQTKIESHHVSDLVEFSPRALTPNRPEPRPLEARRLKKGETSLAKAKMVWHSWKEAVGLRIFPLT